MYYDDTLNYNAGLSTTETSVVNELTGQIVYLDLYPWAHHGTSGSGNTPPEVGDSLIVTFPTGADTVVVESVGLRGWAVSRDATVAHRSAYLALLS